MNPAAQQSLLLNSSQVVETSHNQNRIVQQQDLFTKSQNYLENILLPGVYQLTKYFEFRFILLGFAALFILILTVLYRHQHFTEAMAFAFMISALLLVVAAITAPPVSNFRFYQIGVDSLLIVQWLLVVVAVKFY